MSTTNTDERVKLPTAAAYVGCSVDTLRRRIRDGVLKAERIGPGIRATIVVKVSDLDRLLAFRAPGVFAPVTPPADALPVALARLEARLKAIETAIAGELR
jgi:excisionase family DNA binding protein